MPANTSPISPIAPATSWSTPVLTGNTAVDGTGTAGTFFTAGTNGARVGRIRVQPLGANLICNVRFFVNNVSTPATPANNSFIGEINMPACTAISHNSIATGTAFVQFIANIVLKPGHRLMYTVGVTVANGYAITCPDAGDY